MALTLISVEDGYNVHEDERGDEVLIAITAPFPRIVEWWEDFDLADAWFDAFQIHRAAGFYTQPDRNTFVADLDLAVADPESIDVVWCQDCQDPVKGEDAETVSDGYACLSCYEDYRSCDDCGSSVHYETMSSTLSDDYVCQSCSESYYSYCDECDGYYHNDCADEHSHGCDCDPPTLAVSMRSGNATLHQDERVAAALPSGVITDEGIGAISRLIRDHGHGVYNAVYTVAAAASREAGTSSWDVYDTPEVKAVAAERGKWWTLSSDLHTLDPQWQTKEGNFTKRLSKLAHKSQGLKFPPELLTKVGNIARDQSNGAEVNLELTRNLNLPAEDFYHDDSCWWQSYSDSRCALKSNGGIGMRTFESWGDRIAGRAWVMPLRLDGDGTLQSTFDAERADAYVVFNGYGDLSGYAPARLLAGMTGMTYRKIGFDCDPMYVNNGTGYLVATEEIAAKYPAGSHLSLDVHTHSDLYHREQARQLVGV